MSSKAIGEPELSLRAARCQIINQPFVSYHLANPKTGGFLAFVLDMLIIGFTVVMLGTSIGASILNYRASLDTGRAPRWLPATLTGVAGLLIGAILMAGLAPSGAAPTTTTYTNGVPTVHMSAGNFTQTSITIAKGSKLLVVDDVSIIHILANGTWSNGVAQPTHEPGAPSIANLQLQGNSAAIGPFTRSLAFPPLFPKHCTTGNVAFPMAGWLWFPHDRIIFTRQIALPFVII